MRCLVVLPLLIVTVTTVELPATAAKALKMVRSGQLTAEFDDGGFIAPHGDSRMQMGGCLLDKVRWITEDPVLDHPEDRMDFAANLVVCCTLDENETKSCVRDISKGYKTVQQLGGEVWEVLGSLEALQEASNKVISQIIGAARGRICETGKPLVTCPAFVGDDKDMNLLRLCPNIEKTGECEGLAIGKVEL